MGADKQKPFARPILWPGMPTNRTSLTGVVGIYPDGYTVCHSGFVRGFRLHIRKTPGAYPAIGFTPFHRSILRVATFGTITDVLEPLHGAIPLRYESVLLDVSDNLSPCKTAL